MSHYPGITNMYIVLPVEKTRYIERINHCFLVIMAYYVDIFIFIFYIHISQGLNCLIEVYPSDC